MQSPLSGAALPAEPLAGAVRGGVRPRGALPGSARAWSRRRRQAAAGRARAGEQARRDARLAQVRLGSAVALAGLCGRPLVWLPGSAPVHGLMAAGLQLVCLAAAVAGPAVVGLALARCLQGR